MERSRWLDNTQAYAAVLRSNARRRQWVDAVRLYLAMPQRQVLPDEIALNGVLFACEEVGAWSWAVWLLQKSQPIVIPDVACFRKALSCCRKAHQWRWACQLLADLAGLGFAVDAATMREAIAACQGAHLGDCTRRRSWHLVLPHRC